MGMICPTPAAESIRGRTGIERMIIIGILLGSIKKYRKSTVMNAISDRE